MQLEQFNTLMPATQEDAVWKYGIFLGNTDNEDSICEVYQVFDFYVGLYYQLKKSAIPAIVAKSSLAQLPFMGIPSEISGLNRENGSTQDFPRA